MFVLGSLTPRKKVQTRRYCHSHTQWNRDARRYRRDGHHSDAFVQRHHRRNFSQLDSYRTQRHSEFANAQGNHSKERSFKSNEQTISSHTLRGSSTENKLYNAISVAATFKLRPSQMQISPSPFHPDHAPGSLESLADKRRRDAHGSSYHRLVYGSLVVL